MTWNWSAADFTRRRLDVYQNPRKDTTRCEEGAEPAWDFWEKVRALKLCSVLKRFCDFVSAVSSRHLGLYYLEQQVWFRENYYGKKNYITLNWRIYFTLLSNNELCNQPTQLYIHEE